jgi:hypothetical protein
MYLVRLYCLLQLAAAQVFVLLVTPDLTLADGLLFCVVAHMPAVVRVVLLVQRTTIHL